jgi:hypothetical protein
VVHHLTVQGGGCELTPIHHQGVVSVAQRHRTNIPIGVDLMALAGPPFTDQGFNAAATLQKLDPLIQQRMGVGFAHQDEFRSLRQQVPAKGFMAVQVIAEHGHTQGAYSLPQRPSQRLAASSSQSCFAWPSRGCTNSGTSGITLSQPGLTTTGVSTEWKYVTEPLA